MNTEEFKRKLTAILSADVEGYSRLMGEDEDATIRTLTTYRELMSTLIQKHRGRVVDSPGDNLLAEFGSVVDSVRCAVEIQEELRVRNAELPDNRKMHFRIGINLGDVIEEGERIYGDGVNIAARVEGLALGGGICISGAVYDGIKNKLSLSYESLGEHTVKNIKEPIRVYRMRVGPETAAPVAKKDILRKWKWAALAAVIILIIGALVVWNFYFRTPPIEPASIEKMAFPLPDQPSIAVLPFVNLSGDPKDDFFSDGLTEEIITALSKITGLFVIARNSTFTYKDKPVKVQRVAEELGVQYVLEGGVRKRGDKIRITAQLIDALTGRHLWAERYDRNLSTKGIFEIQDGITIQVLKSLQIKLTKAAATYLRGGRTENLEAYLKVMNAIDLQLEYSLEKTLKARQLLEEAIALDPDYIEAYAVLAHNFRYEGDNATDSTKIRESYDRGIEMAKKAISLDENNANAYIALGHCYYNRGMVEKGKESFEKAIELDPNNPDTYSRYAYYILRPKKSYDEAISYVEKAKRLNPFPDWYYYFFAGHIYYESGNYDKAIPELKQSIKIRQQRERPVPHASFYYLIISCLCLGREEEAYAAATELLKIKPQFPLEMDLSIEELHNNAAKKRLLDALHKAGLLQKQKEEEVAIGTAMKWKSEGDGFVKDGVFIRKNPPAFSLKYPTDFVIQPRRLNEILRINIATIPLPMVNIIVGKMTGKFNKCMLQYEQDYKKTLEKLGSSNVTVIYNKPLPRETYGEDYPSQELEVTYVWGGAVALRCYQNVIAKGGYYISIRANFSVSDVDMERVNRIKAIFKTIDLEP